MIAVLTAVGMADTIKIEKAKVAEIGKSIDANAKITQLSNQKQEVVSMLGGHIENYFVGPGSQVKKGDKLVLIESLDLSRMTAEYLALEKQKEAAKYDLDTAEKLFKKGVGSEQERNAKMIALQEIKSKKNTLKSQLHSLGVDPTKLQSATDKLILYAHADGVVGELLVPLHATVDAKTPLMTLVKQSGYYALAYLDIADAMQMDSSTKGQIILAGREYPCSFVQVLPQVDSETQRAQALFRINGEQAAAGCFCADRALCSSLSESGHSQKKRIDHVWRRMGGICSRRGTSCRGGESWAQ